MIGRASLHLGDALERYDERAAYWACRRSGSAIAVTNSQSYGNMGQQWRAPPEAHWHWPLLLQRWP
jgi:hypothetical protein